MVGLKTQMLINHQLLAPLLSFEELSQKLDAIFCEISSRMGDGDSWPKEGDVSAKHRSEAKALFQSKAKYPAAAGNGDSLEQPQTHLHTISGKTVAGGSAHELPAISNPQSMSGTTHQLQPSLVPTSLESKPGLKMVPASPGLPGHAISAAGLQLPATGSSGPVEHPI